LIITEKKPYGMIKAELKKGNKIGIISCNSCAKLCGTGGKEQMMLLAKQLKKDGFDVIDKKVIGSVCNFDQLKRSKVKGDTIIVLACSAGLYNVKQIYKNKKIIPALDTIGLGVWNEKGDIKLVKKIRINEEEVEK